MPGNPLHDETRELAEKVAGGPVARPPVPADAAAVYNRERMMALGMIAVDSMAEDGLETVDVDEQHPLLVACRERLRDRLSALLEWAVEKGDA